MLSFQRKTSRSGYVYRYNCFSYCHLFGLRARIATRALIILVADLPAARPDRQYVIWVDVTLVYEISIPPRHVRIIARGARGLFVSSSRIHLSALQVLVDFFSIFFFF